MERLLLSSEGIKLYGGSWSGSAEFCLNGCLIRTAVEKKGDGDGELDISVINRHLVINADGKLLILPLSDALFRVWFKGHLLKFEINILK